MKTIRVSLAVVLVLLVGGFAVSCGKKEENATPSRSAKKGVRYQCSMHPNIVQDHPGTCPICGMNLTPIGASEGAMIEGRASVMLSTQQEQLISLRVEPTRKLVAVKIIRAPGRVRSVEGKLSRVTFRVQGWVEKLYAESTGQFVKAGDPLLEIYSPDLLVAEREFVSALKSDNLAAAPRKKLELLGVSAGDIEELARTREPKATVTLRAPSSGYIEQKSLWLKKAVTGEDYIDIVDLSAVWVIADLYENELPLVQAGQEAVVSLPSGGVKKFTGHVAYVYPTLDEKTRTGHARVDAPNPDLALKPGMFANVEIEVALGERIVVPTEAVFDQGTRQYLFVSKGSGQYEPREVTLGPRAQAKVGDHFRDVYAVERGVEADEQIVVSGNFLLDSESHQRASAAATPPSGQGTTEHQHH